MAVKARLARAAARLPLAVWFAAAVLSAFASASCGFFPGDSFPDWLPYIESETDFKSIVATLDLGARRSVNRLELAPWTDAEGTDLSKVLLFVSCDDGEALVALAPETLALAASWRRIDSGFGSMNQVIKASAAGFMAGGLEFDPENLGAAPFTLPGIPPDGGWVFSAGDPPRNYLVYIQSGTDGEFVLASYDESYGDEVSSARLIDPVGSYVRLLDAEYIDGMFRLLAYAAPAGSTSYGGYVFSFADEASLLSTEPLLASDGSPADGVELTGPFPLSDDRAWLTEGGVVTLNHDDDEILRRYAYGVASEAVDELTLRGDDEDLEILDFEPSGKRWYLLDGWSERLYELRTWW